MSTFPGNPSGPTPTGFEAWEEPAAKPARTSILAIAALVLSILCVTAPLGLVFGIAAMIRVATSNGRRTGMGLGVAAVVIGLILSSFWAFVGMGVAQAGKFMVKTPGEVVAALAKGDVGTARPYFAADAAAKLDDATIAKFKAAYEAEVGAFRRPPNSVWELCTSYVQIGRDMRYFQGSNDKMPVPMHFEKGLAVVGMQISRSAPNAAGPGLFEQVLIVTRTGKVIELFPTRAGGAPPATAPGTVPPPSAADTPGTPAAPASPASPPPGGG